MQILFKNNDKAQLLKLSNFSWNANELCRNFHGLKTQERFIEKFKEIFPSEAGGNKPDKKTAVSASPGPSAKRARLQLTTIMPATRQASSSSSDPSSSLGEICDDEFDETEMDKAIYKHFQG